MILILIAIPADAYLLNGYEWSGYTYLLNGYVLNGYLLTRYVSNGYVLMLIRQQSLEEPCDKTSFEKKETQKRTTM